MFFESEKQAMRAAGFSVIAGGYLGEMRRGGFAASVTKRPSDGVIDVEIRVDGTGAFVAAPEIAGFASVGSAIRWTVDTMDFLTAKAVA